MSTLCVCCGARYEDECPNLDRVHHSPEFALLVVMNLHLRGVDLNEAPSREELEDAILTARGAMQ